MHGFEKLDPVNSHPQNFEKLLIGRIDLLAQGSRIFRALRGRSEVDGDIFKPALKLEGVSQSPFLLANKNSDQEFIERVTKAYDAVVAAEVYDSSFMPVRKTIETPN